MTEKYRSLGVMVVMPLNSSLLICCTGARRPSRSRPVVFSASKETQSGTGWLIFGGFAPQRQPTAWQRQDTTDGRGSPVHRSGGSLTEAVHRSVFGDRIPTIRHRPE